MIEEHIKEQLSQSYARAVAAKAGILCSKDDYDYGFDGTFKDIISYDTAKKRYSCSGFAIDYQIKSSVNVICENGYLKYDLRADNYNDLIRTDAGTERILILFSLPDDPGEWLKVDINQMTMKKCAWWCSLKGHPVTANQSTVRIQIPIRQILTPNELRRLMDCVKKGVEL